MAKKIFLEMYFTFYIFNGLYMKRNEERAMILYTLLAFRYFII